MKQKVLKAMRQCVAQMKNIDEKDVSPSLAGFTLADRKKLVSSVGAEFNFTIAEDEINRFFKGKLLEFGWDAIAEVICDIITYKQLVFTTVENGVRRNLMTDEEPSLDDMMRAALLEVKGVRPERVFPYVIIPDYGINPTEFMELIKAYADILLRNLELDKIEMRYINEYFGQQDWKTMTTCQFSVNCYNMVGYAHHCYMDQQRKQQQKLKCSQADVWKAVEESIFKFSTPQTVRVFDWCSMTECHMDGEKIKDVVLDVAKKFNLRREIDPIEIGDFLKGDYKTWTVHDFKDMVMDLLVFVATEEVKTNDEK